MVRRRAPVRRGDVYWVNLDPTVGTEVRKTRPALIVSPGDMNEALPWVLVAPITSKGQPLGCRPEVELAGRPARILLDQIRSVDKRRLGPTLGSIDRSIERASWHPQLLEMVA